VNDSLLQLERLHKELNAKTDEMNKLNYLSQKTKEKLRNLKFKKLWIKDKIERLRANQKEK
jgi:hypothetical protein